MNIRRSGLVSPKIVKITAAVIIGLSIGGLLPPDPVLVPALGIELGVLVGVLGVSIGAVLYTQVPKWIRPSECGCAGECGCS